MKPVPAICAFFLAAGLAACQSASQPNRLGRGLDGTWASDDGVFVATFDAGRFTSRLNSTGEIVADGRYVDLGDGGGAQLTWFSVVSQEQRTAVCTFLAPGRVQCEPNAGNAFTMTKTG